MGDVARSGIQAQDRGTRKGSRLQEGDALREVVLTPVEVHWRVADSDQIVFLHKWTPTAERYERYPQTKMAPAGALLLDRGNQPLVHMPWPAAALVAFGSTLEPFAPEMTIGTGDVLSW